MAEFLTALFSRDFLPAVWGRWTAGIVLFLWATLTGPLATAHWAAAWASSIKSDPRAAYSRGRWTRDDGANGPFLADVTASVLLVIGYPLALGALARLRPVLAERRVWWFAALEAATASITAGWLLHGRPLPAAVNGAALAGFAIAWLITGQRAGPRATKAR